MISLRVVMINQRVVMISQRVAMISQRVAMINQRVDIPSFRLIGFSISTFNYNRASHLGKMVQEVTPTEYSSSDNFTLLQDSNKADIKNKCIVLFDVCSLFTNIPLDETIDLAVENALCFVRMLLVKNFGKHFFVLLKRTLYSMVLSN